MAQDRNVTDLLHTLRGESYRHEQNARGARSISSLRPDFMYTPSMPPELMPQSRRRLRPSPFLAEDEEDEGERSPMLQVTAEWSDQEQSRRPMTWRRHALSLAYTDADVDTLPSLTRMCLRRLVQCYSLEDISAHLSPSLRSMLVRQCALWTPLDNAGMTAVHADGGVSDLIVVGSRATPDTSLWSAAAPRLGPEQEDWDTEATNESDPVASVRMLAFVSTSFGVPDFLNTLPRLLTTLVLVNIKNPLPIHRLPSVCPALGILDLSYNRWFTENDLNRIDWRAWMNLRLIGMRGVRLDRKVVFRAINRQRWVDVDVIFESA